MEAYGEKEKFLTRLDLSEHSGDSALRERTRLRPADSGPTPRQARFCRWNKLTRVEQYAFDEALTARHMVFPAGLTSDFSFHSIPS